MKSYVNDACYHLHEAISALRKAARSRAASKDPDLKHRVRDVLISTEAAISDLEFCWNRLRNLEREKGE